MLQSEAAGEWKEVSSAAGAMWCEVENRTVLGWDLWRNEGFQ